MSNDPFDLDQPRMDRPAPPRLLRQQGLAPWLKYALGLASFCAFGALVAFVYFKWDAADVPPPLIRANPDPVKVPVDEADAGGMDVPYRDTLVFNIIGKNANEGQEKLAPPAPEPKPASAAVLDAPDTQTRATEPPALPPGTIAVKEPKPVPPPPLPGSPPVVETVPAKPLPEPADKPLARPPGADQVAAVASPQTTPVISGQHFIQLGAYSRREGAEAEWQNMQKTMGGLFPSAEPVVQTRERDGKTLYLLWAGPWNTAAGARTACDQVKARKGNCFLVQSP